MKLSFMHSILRKATGIAFLMVLCNSIPSSGQGHSIENVNFTIQENNIAVIFYDLEARGKNKRYNVELSLRQKQNPFFIYKPTAITGDAGKGRFEGKQNQIVWGMGLEPREQFTPNPFINDYYFTVEAKRKSSAGWWILLTIAGGTAYYFLNNDPFFN